MSRKDDPSSAGVKRRSVLRGLATGFAGAVVAPASGSAATAEGSAPRPGGQLRAASDAGLPRLLSEHELPTLVSLCELLVPGSVDADVPDLVDRTTAVAAPEDQKAFMAAIRGFEGEARSAHAARWVDLGREAQMSILHRAANGDRPALQEHLVYLRDTVARAYFATQPGMRKLGWTRRPAWRELPACDHSDDDHR